MTVALPMNGGPRPGGRLPDVDARRIRVLVADSQQPIRAGVRAVLAGTEFAVVAEAFTATTAVHEARRNQPDICLVAVAMPGGGIEAAARIRQLVPHARIVMLSVSEDGNDLMEALRAGAHGYLPLSIDPERLASALRGVMRGEAPIPRALVSAMAEEFFLAGSRPPAPAQAAEEGLTPREREVLDLLAHRMTTSAIAARLHISPATVRSHVATILRKLRVADRDAAVQRVRPVSPTG